MSTKITIASGERFHLYQDFLDDACVHLEIEGGEFRADHQGLRVAIPIEIWEYVRQFTGTTLPYLNATDAELQDKAERDVSERSLGDPRGIRSLWGYNLYGYATDPREEQIARGVTEMQRQRASSRALVEKMNGFMAGCRPPRQFEPDASEQ